MTEMLEKAIEIEGLIRILKNGTPSPEIYNLIYKKADALALWAQSQTKAKNPSNNIPDSTIQNRQNTTIQNRPDTTTQNRQNSSIQNRPESSIQDIPDSAIKEEIEDDMLMEVAEAEEHQIPSEDDITLTLDNDETIKDSNENENLKKDADEKGKSEGVKKQIPQPAEVKCLTNLKAYFSLNDRFLYSRELFDGNMKMFDATLRKLEGVSDFSVVEDYFYNELDWDPENEYVKSFMDILQSKF